MTNDVDLNKEYTRQLWVQFYMKGIDLFNSDKRPNVYDSLGELVDLKYASANDYAYCFAERCLIDLNDMGGKKEV